MALTIAVADPRSVCEQFSKGPHCAVFAHSVRKRANRFRRLRSATT